MNQCLQYVMNEFQNETMKPREDHPAKLLDLAHRRIRAVNQYKIALRYLEYTLMLQGIFFAFSWTCCKEVPSTCFFVKVQ